MPLTVVVRSADPEARITFDAPRVVIGRGPSCDVRLPDPSVSLRHASVAADAGVYSLVDEASRNGTFVGGVRLSPRAPRVLKDGDLVRVGRVWLEMRIDQAAPPERDLPTATRDLALALVSQAMRALGDDTITKVRIVEGAGAGAATGLLALEEEGRPYLVGRGETCELLIDDPDGSREHVQLVRRGSVVLARDLGSKNGVWIGDTRLEPGRDVVWRPTMMLRVGHTVLALDEPVARALADLESMPDEEVAPEDVPPPPERAKKSRRPRAAAPDADVAGHDYAPARNDDANAPAVAVPERDARAATTTPAAFGGRERSWSTTDLTVVVLAVVVLAASVAGLVWLLRG